MGGCEDLKAQIHLDFQADKKKMGNNKLLNYSPFEQITKKIREKSYMPLGEIIEK